MLKPVNDNPHPELDRWLALALKHDWPDLKPMIVEDRLMLPHFYDRDGERVVEWVTVSSRASLLSALGY